jgi:hypothetical protein
VFKAGGAVAVSDVFEGIAEDIRLKRSPSKTAGAVSA